MRLCCVTMSPLALLVQHSSRSLMWFCTVAVLSVQAVLVHPFTRSCSHVQRCMQLDLKRVNEAQEASSPRGCYTFEQRRLVRPGLAVAVDACGAGGFVPAAAPAAEKVAVQPAAAAAAGSCRTVDGGGGSSNARAGNWRHFRRRLAPSCKELMFVRDGDQNGVVHYIGTDYGSKQWVNPVACKALDIKASSPPSRYTDPKVRELRA
eukprot:GHRQ01029326.1.p1 GENE.GHRQ01029326.1~~GHRQ01029326.1.p1  ORF type:complete len:206 (+),score=76.74 GHRQ01029326.1:726-1343(+)